jgi:hypothetical protein
MLEGNFDFNCTLMAPPGTKIILHEKPAQRKSWDPHGTEGWYLGPALEHCRCYRVFTNKTKAERNSDTVEFFPQHMAVPYRSPTDVAIQATQELIHVLKISSPSTPFAHMGHDQHKAIQTIADVFQTHLQQPAHGSPRVTKPNATSPQRVNKHRYPTRNRQPLGTTKHEINHTTTTTSSDATIHQWANAIIDPNTGASMEYSDLMKSPKHTTAWTKSFLNELGCLAQGIADREKGTNTVFFIHHDQVPHDQRKDVTYGRICVDYRPQKKEPNRTRLTVGGNLIDYPGDVSTPTASTITAKLVINSTISTPQRNTCVGT